MDSFALKVIGFSCVFYEGEALQVQVPLQDGLVGIMAHHENAVLGIVPGTLRLQQPDGGKAIPPKRRYGCRRADAGTSLNKRRTVTFYVERYRRQFNFGISFFKACDTTSGRRLINLSKKEFQENEKNKKPDRAAYGSCNVPVPVFRLRQRQRRK